MLKTVRGRRKLVRWYQCQTGGVSAPLTYDRLTKKITPYVGQSWARQEYERADYVRQQRQKSWQSHILQQQATAWGHNLPLTLLWDTFIPGYTNQPINSAYVYGASGVGVANRITPVTDVTVTDFYYYVHSFTGTAASVSDIDLEIRTAHYTGKPEATLIEAKAHDPASTVGWRRSTGWAADLSAATGYALVIADATGNGTNYATIRRCASSSPYGYYSGGLVANNYLKSGTTSNGFQGWGTSGAACCMVVICSDGTAMGLPFSNTPLATSSQDQRGLRIAANTLADSLGVYAYCWSNSGTSSEASGLAVWRGATGPTGTPDVTPTDYALNTSGDLCGGYMPSGGLYQLSPTEAYRFVATYSSNQTGGPRYSEIGVGADANLKSALPAGGGFYYARSNGTSDWSNDNEYALPDIALLVDSVPRFTPSGIYLGMGM